VPTAAPAPVAGESTDLAGLHAALTSAGLQPGPYVESPKPGAPPDEYLFAGTTRSQDLSIGRGQVTVFTFSTPAVAAKAASRVDQTGGLPFVDFVGAPHFFLANRTIVMYVEQRSTEDSAVIGVLRARFGSELARK